MAAHHKETNGLEQTSSGELGKDSDVGAALQQVMTNTYSISPDIFEKVFLQPKNAVKGQLRSTLANPTPIAIAGFVVGLTPLSCEYMGWRGTTDSFAVATTTASIWFGGALLFIGGILEFILGNTFPMLVFFGYGAHFFTVGTLFVPAFNAVGFYAADGMGPPNQTSPIFQSGVAFYTLSMGLLSLCFLLGSLRTNLVFLLIFVCATSGFGCASGAFWHGAAGNMVLFNRLLIATGGFFFAASLLGWYLLFAIVITTMELPIPDLPVFDLSTVIKARKRKSE